ncbi:uncharacterized protein LOC143446685 [Clavelina lepadiformis]|uniref:uncharacterized protein LOC143446685 n=1 Tax=Clavelina lepadiformis TaxID=159417 RepID=UPI004043195B
MDTLSMETKFVLLESTLSIATCIVLYIAIALSCHACRYKTAEPRSQSVESLRARRNLPSTSHQVDGIVANVAVNSNRSVALRRLIVASAWLVVVKCLLEQLNLLSTTIDIGFLIGCDIIIRINVILYTIPLTTEYVFLWVRQRVIYLHPIIYHRTTKCTKAASWMVLVVLVIGQVATLTLFMVNEQYDDVSVVNVTNSFCEARSAVVFPYAIPWIVLAAFTLSFQIIFLALFGKPLVTRSNTIQHVISARGRPKRNIYPLLKRVFVASGACFITDMIMIAGTLAAQDVVIVSVILDINLVIKIICLLLTYPDWVKRLFPCLFASNDTPTTSRRNTRSKAGISSSRSPISSISTNVETLDDC